MSAEKNKKLTGISRQAEEKHLQNTLAIIHSNIEKYGQSVSQMRAEIDDMLEHFHDDNPELINTLENTITLHDHMDRALERNKRAQRKPYFGRIIFHDEQLNKEESLYIGRGGISEDATHPVVVDWRAPVANAYYENGLGKCSYLSPEGKKLDIDLMLKRTYEIEDGKLLNYFDSEVIANDELLTKYLAKNKQAVLGEIVATIQKEQNEIIRRSPYHNCLVQGVAGSGKTTVAMHRISYILYNYAERFRPEDFYIVGSNRILLNYITGVLPGLDVYGVKQMTMEQLFVRLLYEDWDDKKYRIRSTSRTGRSGIIKGSLAWFRDLQAFCDRLEWNLIPRDSIRLNPRQFVEGFQDGKTGVFDRSSPTDSSDSTYGATGTSSGGAYSAAGVSSDGSPRMPAVRKTVSGQGTADQVLLMDSKAIERYIRQNPAVSIQSKIDMLNSRLYIKIKDEFLGKGVKYTAAEKKAIVKAYRGSFGARTWKRSIYDIYEEFLKQQQSKGHNVDIPTDEFDVYDLAALAFLYKRVKETEVISEAHHVVIDEAQDFGMMAYSVLKFCIKDCTYTIMGDVSQNIHFGYGLNDWEDLKTLYLTDPMSGFEILKKSYRNTIEISDFATNILHHGQFFTYPVEPIIRHGKPVTVESAADRTAMIRRAADVCRSWQAEGLDTIAVVCRNQQSAEIAAAELKQYLDIMESDLEKAEFGKGILVLPVEYTKGLEFDAVLILDPTREDYPADDGHAKLLYVAATRALHQLCVLHTGDLTGLIADPVPERKQTIPRFQTTPIAKGGNGNSQRTDSGTSAAIGKTTKSKIVIAANPAMSHPGVTTENNNQAGITSTGKVPTSARGTDTSSAASAQNKSSAASNAYTGKTAGFGDMPPTEKLRPVGHPKIDLAVRWVNKQPDGLYLQSRYGVLRLSPISNGIIRVTFAKGNQLLQGTHPRIAVTKTERAWMYKDSSKTVDLMTDELCLQVDKSAGTLRYMTRDKKLLLAERPREARQIEDLPGSPSTTSLVSQAANPLGSRTGIGPNTRKWLFLDWQKEEKLYGLGDADTAAIPLRGTARYLSQNGMLPFLLSDKGYGILLASDGPAFSCDIPTYGSYLYTEGAGQMDYYFIVGKQANTILAAFDYLCGN